MARRRVEIITSDLTGKEIGGPEDVAEIRLLEHPLIDAPVRLDAYVQEVVGLENDRRELVTIELALPDTPAERIVLDREVFDRLFKSDVNEVLAAADPYLPDGPAGGPRRRTRTAAEDGVKSFSATPGESRREREAIRTWANANGYTVGDRGRIAANIIEAFRAAQES